jgi:hypothetical protein
MSILNRNGWAVYEVKDPRYPNHTVHTVPILDIFDHALSPRCSCIPTLDGERVTHSSYDGREHIEQLLDMSKINFN